MSRSVLVVEDERQLAEVIRLNLCDLNCTVQLASDGHAGLIEAESREWGLIILDVMLPGMDGLEILRRVRVRSPTQPVLLLTAKSTELDRVLGLELGADDYLTKPFSMLELLARVKAVFRRQDAFVNGLSSTTPQHLQVGELALNPKKRSATLDGRILDLTVKEFDLLYFFVSNPGHVYNRLQLLDAVWGYSYSGYEHTVNTHINRLRGKLELNPAKPKYVLTVWGVGYKFRET